MNNFKLSRFLTTAVTVLGAAVIFALPSFASYYVNDAADLFTDEEEAELESYAEQIQSDYGMTVAVLTSEEANSDSLDFADIYYEDNYGHNTDGMVFFIDMYNRVPTISTSGAMIDYITDSRLNALFDGCDGYLQNADYYSAAYSVVAQTAGYIGDGIPQGQHRVDTAADTGFIFRPMALLAGILAGAVLALIVKSAVSKGYELKGSTYSYDFKRLSKVTVTGKTDKYLRTGVVRTPRAQSSDSDSSSTHTSSSGDTHGGGSGSSF